MAQLALVVLELDFCVLERVSTRATLDETAEMDAFHNLATVARLLEFVRGGRAANRGQVARNARGCNSPAAPPVAALISPIRQSRLMVRDRSTLPVLRQCGSVQLDLCVDDGRLAPAREQPATHGADRFGARRGLGGSA